MKLGREMKLGMLALALAAGGCNTYKYFDIDVSFDPLTFDSTDVATISICRVTVSGADNGQFEIANCPPHSVTAPLEVGPFEYSSFADSGTMTFKVDTFTSKGQTDNCKNGFGMVPIPVTSATTITGTLQIAKTGPGCLNTTPVGDSGT
jgi:hypothetical protein